MSARVFNLGFAFVFACLSALATYANADAEDEQAAAFVRGFDKIRIGVTQAPRNGHQAYTILTMKRLRALGFTGEFELYFDPAVKGKMENLIPGFAEALKSPQEIRGLGRLSAHAWTTPEGFKKGTVFVNEVTAANFLNGKRGVVGVNYAKSAPQLTLGVMGGDDWGVTANQLNVEALIRVQPSGWFKNPSVSLATDDFHSPESTTRYLAPELNRLPTRVEIPNPSNPIEFLREETRANPDMRAKLRGLETLVNLQGEAKIETLAVYGLGTEIFGNAERAANVVRAIKLAQKRSPEKFRGPVVIPFFETFSDDAWGTFNREMAATPEFLENFTIMNSMAPQIESTLKKLGKKEVLLMPIGPVPQDVWHYLFYKSTLPPTVSGANGTNFMAVTGRPYIKIADPMGREYDPSHPRASELNEGLGNSLNFGGSELSAEMIQKAKEREWKKLEKLSQFFIDARTPGSTVNMDFANHATDIRAQADKVSSVLNRSVEEIDRMKNRSVRCKEAALQVVTP